MTRGTEVKGGGPATDAVTVWAHPPDAGEFEPFGSFLEPPDTVGGRAHFESWLSPVADRALQSHLNRVAPAQLPLVLDRVECHPHAAQVFLPVSVSRYLVTVMPSDPSGSPDPTRARAFVVPGDRGVVYRPGVWHAGITVLEAEGSFAVLMWRNGSDDDVFVPIPPVEVRIPAPERGAGD